MKKLLLAGVVSVFSLFGSAKADTLTWSSYTWNGASVTIGYSGSTENVGAGPIFLNTPNGIVMAYCVDIFDILQGSGTFTVQAPVGLNTNDSAFEVDAANLMPLGAGGGDAGAAAQLAIWTLLYNGVDDNTLNVKTGLFTFSASSAITALVNADYAYLGYNGSNTDPNFDPTASITYLFSNVPGLGPSQNLITEFSSVPHGQTVPEPASLALLGLGFLGTLAFRKKRS